MNPTARDKFIAWLLGFLEGSPPDKVWPLDRTLIRSRLDDALAEREPKPIGPKVVDGPFMPEEPAGYTGLRDTMMEQHLKEKAATLAAFGRIPSPEQERKTLAETMAQNRVVDAGIAKYVNWERRIEALEKSHAVAIENGREAHAGHRERLDKLEEHARLGWMPTPINASLRPTLPGETFLEQHNRERAEAQAAALKARLSKQDAEELQRYRDHTPNGQPRYGTPEWHADQRRQQEQLRKMSNE